MTNARRLAASVFTAAVLTAGLIAGTAGAANAATTISKSTIDGKMPAAMGCKADQKTIYHKLIKNGAGTPLGYIDLMASNHCHSVWAHVHSTSKTRDIFAQIVRKNGSSYAAGATGTTDLNTQMLWDKGTTSHAIGMIATPNGTFKVQTANY